LFSGLDQGKKYYFKVTDNNTELTSDAVEGETEAFNVVQISSSKANVGDVILAEDFSELIWGGDYVLDAPGYSSSKRGSLDSFLKAEANTSPMATITTMFHPQLKSACSTRWQLP
jgi:hypothetical protein